MSGLSALGRNSCAPIATLTLNPTIDTALETREVVHTQKIRTWGDRLDAGGGGINAARVLARFGAPVHAIFLAGGSTGRLLDRLLQREGIARTMVPIAGETRVSVTVYEESTGREFRFVPEGPSVSELESLRCLDAISHLECEYLIVSGSLPRGVTRDFYARLARIIAERPIRLVLDCSGEELELALRGGGIFLLKPNRSELEELAGRDLATAQSIIEVASQIVSEGAAERVAVTLGDEGAALVSRDGAQLMAAIEVDGCSAVGAGDSFLAAMTYAFACGGDGSTALRLGVAAGAAATLSPGTDLCHPWDVHRLATRTPARSGA